MRQKLYSELGDYRCKMKSYLAVLVLLPCCLADGYGHDNYGTHNSGYGDPYGDPYGKDSRSVHSSGYGHSDPYGNPHGRSYSHGNSGYGYKKSEKFKKPNNQLIFKSKTREDHIILICDLPFQKINATSAPIPLTRHTIVR